MVYIQIQPIGAESKPPPVFVVAFYSDTVQQVLRKYAPALRALWQQVLDAAVAGGRQQALVQDAARLLLALRGSAISMENSELDRILKIANRLAANDDASTLFQPINQDDFAEMLCRVVGSELWVYSSTGSRPPSRQQQLGGPPSLVEGNKHC